MVNQKKVAEIKEKVLGMCVNAGVGHVTSAFSCAEIISILYYEIMQINPENPEWEDRDRFIMSKNHGSVMTYPILQDLGYIGADEAFLKNGSRLGIHTKLEISGVDFCGGSLGIGLGFACGLAYSAKLSKKDYRTFCILGDGECYEGSVWESFLFGGAKKLNNLIAIIDRNALCITDFTEKMLPLNPMKEKLEAFGWEAREIDGHNLDEIRNSLSDIRSYRERPLCIIADTVKGHGINFMENAPLWHGKAPTDEAAFTARKELREVQYGS